MFFHLLRALFNRNLYQRRRRQIPTHINFVYRPRERNIQSKQTNIFICMKINVSSRRIHNHKLRLVHCSRNCLLILAFTWICWTFSNKAALNQQKVVKLLLVLLTFRTTIYYVTFRKTQFKSYFVHIRLQLNWRILRRSEETNFYLPISEYLFL